MSETLIAVIIAVIAGSIVGPLIVWLWFVAAVVLGNAFCGLVVGAIFGFCLAMDETGKFLSKYIRRKGDE